MKSDLRMSNVLKNTLNNDKHVQLIGLNGFQTIEDDTCRLVAGY